MGRKAERGQFLKCYEPIIVPFALNNNNNKVMYSPVSIVDVYNRRGVQFYLIIASHTRTKRLQHEED